MSRSKLERFVAASRIMAGAMAAVLFLFGLLAANGAFHETLHHSDKDASNSCVLCLLAKGQVELPQPLSAVTAPERFSSDRAPRWESIALVDFAYLASPSRAPPALALRLTVVA